MQSMNLLISENTAWYNNSSGDGGSCTSSGNNSNNNKFVIKGRHCNINWNTVVPYRNFQSARVLLKAFGSIINNWDYFWFPSKRQTDTSRTLF
jgi:hypothetical protein